MQSETELLKAISSGRDLSALQAGKLIGHLCSDSATDQERREFLIAMNEKGETPEEITGLIQGILQFAKIGKIDGTTDIVGTGGDRRHTINVSTCSAIVCSALGIRIAKYGNRSSSGIFGSADFMSMAGYPLQFDYAEARRRVNTTNFVFLSAGLYNTAFTKFQKVRKEIGLPTVFNRLGPLTNPARPTHAVIGCTGSDQRRIFASVMRLSCTKGYVINSTDGMDELSPFSESEFSLVSDSIKEGRIHPARELGIRIEEDQITGSKPEEIFAKTMDALAGKNPDGASFIALNSAPAIMVHGMADSFSSAYRMGMKAIKSGLAYGHLQKVIASAGGIRQGEVHG
ncbi:MAG: anthranilate phosphoribosyltransferase [Candidatus Thermoplasmatota archaeon]|nr:anthranilate phosphoribosyltransferase [Candidatus Thermoplasmatota archaeon]